MINVSWIEGISLVCDICDFEVKDFETFGEAVDYKKDNGWKSKKIEDYGWIDKCPKCSKLK